MRNTSRHVAASTSQPPRNGPTAVHTPPKPDQAPTARLRSSCAMVDDSTARLEGTSSAPATPCTARARISAVVVGARPHASDARLNPARPRTSTRRRPKRSPSEPPITIRDPSVSRYASTVHCRSDRPAWNSRAIEGRATLTTVPSRKATPEPRTVTRRTHRALGVAYRSWGEAVLTTSLFLYRVGDRRRPFASSSTLTTL